MNLITHLNKQCVYTAFAGGGAVGMEHIAVAVGAQIGNIYVFGQDTDVYQYLPICFPEVKHIFTIWFIKENIV